MTKEITIKEEPVTLDIFVSDVKKDYFKQEAKKADEIVVTDFSDKKQLEIAKAQQKVLQKLRTATKAEGLSLRDGFTKARNEVIEVENDLLLLITPSEDRLKEIENEANRIEERAERMKILPLRQKQLADIKDGIVCNDETILGMDTKEFAEYSNTRLANKNEKDRLEIEAEKAKLERAKELAEATEKARIEEREKFENEQKNKEIREELERKNAVEKKEREEKEEKERADHEKRSLAAQTKYRNFLIENGCTQATKEDFYIDSSIAGKVVLYKKVGEFIK
jgi:hypothetical protein